MSPDFAPQDGRSLRASSPARASSIGMEVGRERPQLERVRIWMRRLTPARARRAARRLGRARGWMRGRLPGLEAGLLLAGLLLTVTAKGWLVYRYPGASLVSDGLAAITSDAAFFAAVFAVVRLGALVRRGGSWARRAGVALSAATLAWSGLNAAWLVVTGVQLQIGVVGVLLRFPNDWAPAIGPYLAEQSGLLLAAGGVAALWVGGLVVYGLIRSYAAVPAGARRRGMRLIAYSGAASIGLFAIQAAGLGQVQNPALRQAVQYSSHEYAVASLLLDWERTDPTPAATRDVPLAGERAIGLPPEGTRRPNVVLVLLESVGQRASGLEQPAKSPMPTIARLAEEGVQFTSVRVPVTQTSKAFWTVLAGTTPDVYEDLAETVLIDGEYEGLPTILRRVGYRSAFFQMSEGEFGAAAGVFANFGFDWAWFGENLQDPSAKLGYASADDFRMLDPITEWVRGGDEPYLLMLITSVTHHPYVVPSWFGAPVSTPADRMEQTLRYTDAFVAELLERLGAARQGGSGEGLLLCIAGDHGDSLRPEARSLRFVPYEELVRVPWVIHWPGHVAAGQRCTWPCSQLDIAPTLLRILGFDVGAAAFEGRDALTPAPADRRLYFSAWFKGSPRGYLEGDVKRMYWPRSGEVLEYDLRADPFEWSPVQLDSEAARSVREEVWAWERGTRLEFSPQRFREREVFGSWHIFSSGRYSRAVYLRGSGGLDSEEEARDTGQEQ